MGSHVTLQGHRTEDGSINLYRGQLVTDQIGKEVALGILALYGSRFSLHMAPDPYHAKRNSPYVITANRKDHPPNLAKLGGRVGSVIHLHDGK